MTRTRSSYGQLLGGKTLSLSDIQGEKTGSRQRGVRGGRRTTNWQEKVCPHCNIVFFTGTRGTYCSEACASLARRKREKENGTWKPRHPDQLRLKLCK